MEDRDKDADPNSEWAIIRDLLHRPLEELIPSQDLILGLRSNTTRMDTETEQELVQVLGEFRYRELKNAGKLRYLHGEVMKSISDFKDPELDDLKFNPPSEFQFADTDQPLPPLRVPGSTRFLISKESPQILFNNMQNSSSIESGETANGQQHQEQEQEQQEQEPQEQEPQEQEPQEQEPQEQEPQEQEKQEQDQKQRQRQEKAQDQEQQVPDEQQEQDRKHTFDLADDPYSFFRLNNNGPESRNGSNIPEVVEDFMNGNDNDNEVTNDNDNELTNDNANELTNDNANELTNDNANELTNDNANELTNDNANEVTNDNDNELTNDNANELTNGNNDLSTNDILNSNHSANSSSLNVANVANNNTSINSPNNSNNGHKSTNNDSIVNNIENVNGSNNSVQLLAGESHSESLTHASKPNREEIVITTPHSSNDNNSLLDTSSINNGKRQYEGTHMVNNNHFKKPKTMNHPENVFSVFSRRYESFFALNFQPYLTPEKFNDPIAEKIFVAFEFFEEIFIQILSNKANIQSLSPMETNKIKSVLAVSNEFLQIYVNKLITFQYANEPFNELLWYNLTMRIIKCTRISYFGMEITNFDKRLASDEFLYTYIDTFTKVIYSILYHTSGGLNMRSINIQNSYIGMVISWVPQIYTVIRMIIQNCYISEQCVSKITLTCIKKIMYCKQVQSAYLSSFLIGSARLLVTIFREYPNERFSLTNEILTIMRHPISPRGSKRPILMENGSYIHVTSFIIILFLQYVDYYDLAELKNKTGTSGVTDRGILEISQKIIGKHKSGFELSNYVIDHLCQLVKDGFKDGVELFVEDLIAVHDCIGFPVIICLLNFLILKACAILDHEVISQQAELALIGICDHIGVLVGNLEKKVAPLPKPFYAQNEAELEEYLGLLRPLLTLYVKRKKDFISFESAFDFFVFWDLFNLQFAISNNSEEIDLDALGSDTLKGPNIAKVAQLQLTKILLDESLLDSDLLKVTNEVVIESYKKLFAMKVHDKQDIIINTMVNCLSKPKIKTRTKAVKALSHLMSVNPQLLLVPKISLNISLMLGDNSPMVRDSVLDLISYFVTSPEMIDKFYIPITECLSDDSVQVRKRGVQMVTTFYSKTCRIDVKAHIISKLLRRIEDEDENIATSVLRYLIQLVFPFSSPINQVNFVTIGKILAGAIGPTTRNSTQYLETFLTKFVFNTDNHQLHRFVRLLIEKVVDFVTVSVDKVETTEISVLLKLIATILSCNGSIFPQNLFTSLQPYIMDESPSNQKIRHHTLQIMAFSLPHIKVLHPEFIDKTVSYLLNNIGKFMLTDLHQAVTCVNELCRIRGNKTIIVNTIISVLKLSLSYIKEFQKQKKLNADAKLIRLLNIIGSFCICDLEDKREIFLKSSLGLKENESIKSLFARFILTFCNESIEISIRTVAIRNLLYICSYSPKLFVTPTVLRILDRELESQVNDDEVFIRGGVAEKEDEADDSDIEVRATKLRSLQLKDGSSRLKILILQCIHNFLVKEDKESRERNGENNKSSTSKSLDLAAFNGTGKSYINDGICATLVQRYIDKVLKLCFIDDGPSAFIPINLLSLIVELGFESPKTVIPTIIALEASGNKHIRKLAARLHLQLFNKHESLVDSSYAEAFKLAVLYRYDNSPNLFLEQFFFTEIYSIVSRTWNSTKKFIQSLTKIFKLDVNLDVSEEEAIFKRDTIIYALLNISQIEFSSLQEIASLANAIAKIITRQGLDLHDQLKEFESMGNQDPLNKEKKVACIYALAVIGLLNFYDYLAVRYGLPPNLMASYKPENTDASLRQAPKVIKDVPFAIGLDEITMADYTQDKCNEIATKYIIAMHEYTN